MYIRNSKLIIGIVYTFGGWHTVARNDLDERSDRNRVEPKRNPKCSRFIDFFFYLEYGSCVSLSLSLYVCAAAAVGREERKKENGLCCRDGGFGRSILPCRRLRGAPRLFYKRVARGKGARKNQHIVQRPSSFLFPTTTTTK